MKILYIHGYNGTPDGPKLDMLRKEYRSATIIAPQHDSVPDHVFELLDRIASIMDDPEDVIIGNSLGGFWANFFSLRHGVPALLINPAVSPSESLKRLGCPFAEEYLPYEEQVKADAISPRTVLLAEDDEVLCHRVAYEFFSGICGVKLLKSGGHGMNDPESIAIIRDSIPGLFASALSCGIHNDD
jgi:predicted esterase YcpF (UPF0227 family)